MSAPNKRPLVVIMILTIIALTLFGVIINSPQPCAGQAGGKETQAGGREVPVGGSEVQVPPPPAPPLPPCADGRVCPDPWECECDVIAGCCPMHINSSASPTIGSAPPRSHDDLFKPWYTQWSVVFLLATLGGILLCCLWFICLKWRCSNGIYYFSCICCSRRPLASERNSSGSLYPPPRYSRCGSFHQAPPPYSEVTSKPDLYPLVITCADSEGKPGNGCILLQYPRRQARTTGCDGVLEQEFVHGHGGQLQSRHSYLRVIQPPGSLSATSTTESLSSTLLCNATNEANSLIPPPYSYSGHYEECVASCGAGGGAGGLLRSASAAAARAPPYPIRAPPRSRTAPDPALRAPRTQAFRDNLITSPVQPLDLAFDLELELIDCEMYCDGGCKPRLGASPPAHRSPLPSAPEPPDGSSSPCDREALGLRHLFPETSGACESPPQPTSPTQSRDSTLTRPSDDRRRSDYKKTSRRKSSLYMPLSLAYPVRTSRISPGSKVSSRSAPATPCGALVPNLLNFSQRISSSRGSRSSKCDEESNPLLVEDENKGTDSKF